MKESIITEKSYDDGAESYARAWVKPHQFIDKERQLFQELVPKGEAILDAGCGPGAEAEYWVNAGYSVTGIDISAKMIAIAKRRTRQAKFLNE